jgi:hypothetical protein
MQKSTQKEPELNSMSPTGALKPGGTITELNEELMMIADETSKVFDPFSGTENGRYFVAPSTQ